MNGLCARRSAIAVSVFLHAALIAAAVRLRPRERQQASAGVVMVSLGLTRPTFASPPARPARVPSPRVEAHTSPRRVRRPVLTARRAPSPAPAEERPAPNAEEGDDDAGRDATSEPSPLPEGGAGTGVGTAPAATAAAVLPEPQRRAIMAEYLAQLLRTKIGPLFKYPPAAERQGIEGRVILRLTVDRAGRILRVERGEPCPHELLCSDAATMLLNAQPLPPPPAELGQTIQLEVPLTYRLD